MSRTHVDLIPKGRTVAAEIFHKVIAGQPEPFGACVCFELVKPTTGVLHVFAANGPDGHGLVGTVKFNDERRGAVAAEIYRPGDLWALVVQNETGVALRRAFVIFFHEDDEYKRMAKVFEFFLKQEKKRKGLKNANTGTTA